MWVWKLQTIFGAMMTLNHNNRRKMGLGSRGFSLIELMIVVAILGALAAAVGIYINTADANLKSFAFNLGSRFKQAKFEAMKRGHDVYLDFDYLRDGVIDNGYSMWVDFNDNKNPDGWVDANGDGVCQDTEGDCVIAEVVFPNKANPAVDRNGPEIYNGAAAFPTGGPDNDGPGAANIGDGVSANGNRFRFRPSGDCALSGAVYIYIPRGAVGAEEVAAGPWAIIVNPVGRIRLDEWQPGTGWISNQ